MKDIIVIDFDKTLCNDGHRDHFAAAKDWEAYHAAHKDDQPWPDVVELLRMCQDEIVVVITGRNERYRQSTLDWLFKHQLHAYIDAILMRPDDNFDSIVVVKIALLEAWFDEFEKQEKKDKPKTLKEPSGFATANPPSLKERLLSRVKFVLDDRDKMVEAYREYGFACWQVR